MNSAIFKSGRYKSPGKKMGSFKGVMNGRWISIVIIYESLSRALQAMTAENPSGFMDHSSILHQMKRLISISMVVAIISACSGLSANYALHDAAYKGNSQAVQSLVKSGAAKESRNSSGMTPLLAAAHFDHLDTVQTLITMGADINAQDQSGMTPLHHAVQSCRLSMVRLLAENAARTDLKAQCGSTALHYAVQCFHKNRRDATAIMNIIIEKTRDLSGVDESGHTPLSLACQYQCEEMIAALRREGLTERCKARGTINESIRAKEKTVSAAGSITLPEAK